MAELRPRVLLAGGGSGGSAAPVIAIAEAIRNRWPGTQFLYLVTTTGPEPTLVQSAGIRFQKIHTGRLRRYLTWRNLVDPVLVGVGLLESMALVARFRPTLGLGAGGFATVPPLLACRFGGVPVIVHQQDVIPGLANRMLAPFASVMTRAFEEGGPSRGRRTRRIGNPVRASVLRGDAEKGRAFLGVGAAEPLVLITGGGTGAAGLNHLAYHAARILVERCHVLHLTGVGKGIGGWEHPRYHQIEFLTEEMSHVLAAADVVVSRAGMSALAEIGALRKPSIIIPMPSSHQEANAKAFAGQGGCLTFAESDLTSARFADEVSRLLIDIERRAKLGEAAGRILPGQAAEAMCDLIAEVLSRPS